MKKVALTLIAQQLKDDDLKDVLLLPIRAANLEQFRLSLLSSKGAPRHVHSARQEQGRDFERLG